MKVRTLSILAAVMLGVSAPAVFAQSKIGFVDSDRVMREAAPALRATERLEREFARRDQELQRMAADLQALQDELERSGLTMSESDRRNKERAFNDLNRDFQRKQREFREDLNQRRNEELALVLDKANAAVKKIAEDQRFDIILQDAVFASPRIDITDAVIRELAGAR